MSSHEVNKAQIKLGNLDIEVFQFPDGSYGYTYEWIAELIQKDKLVLSNRKSLWGLSKLTEGLVQPGFSNKKVRIGSISYAYLTQDQLAVVLHGCAKLEPDVFLPFLLACAMEALDRRANKAFGVVVEEQEYNQRLAARMASLNSFWFFAGDIQQWLENREIPSSKPEAHYMNAFKAMSVGLFGKLPANIKLELGIKKGELNRNHFGVESLRRIDSVQRLAAANLSSETRPKEAVEAAISAFHYPIIDYKN